MVCVAACSKRCYSRFKVCNRGDKLCVLNSGVRKAYNGNAASAAYLTCLCAACSFGDNINKFSRAVFHVGKRASRHTSRTVENKNNISRVAYNVRRCCKRHSHHKRAAAAYAVSINFLVRVGYTH